MAKAPFLPPSAAFRFWLRPEQVDSAELAFPTTLAALLRHAETTGRGRRP